MRDARITRGGRRGGEWGAHEGGPGGHGGHGGYGGHGRGGHPGFGGGRGRTRRGDIRTALLLALGDGPGHGYELIQRLELRSGGRWRPSPGSVYPTLQLLEDEGLAEMTEQDGKRVYSITEAGREEGARRMQRPDGSPWALRGEDAAEHVELREAFRQLAVAFKQVAATGSAEMVSSAKDVLVDARRKLYHLLADS